MFDLSSLTGKSDTEKTDVDSETGSRFALPQNGFINTGLEAIKAALRFAVAKKLYGIILFLAVLAITGKWEHSKIASDGLSTQAANDDWGFFGSFMQEAEIKRSQFNAHPVYKTKAVRKLEHAFELKFGYPVSFKRLFSYVVYKEQDYLVMKKAARGENKKKLKLKLSTLMPGTSADDHCEDYFGGLILNEEMRKEVVSTWKISRIKDELTQENDSGRKYFRCVIDSDTIEDYLEE